LVDADGPTHTLYPDLAIVHKFLCVVRDSPPWGSVRRSPSTEWAVVQRTALKYCGFERTPTFGNE